MATRREEVTRILRAIDRGDREVDELLPVVYDELRGLAAHYLRGERRDHTLQPTALVHEAYMRLLGEGGGWENRKHFYAIAARAMRNVLVDHARGHRAVKRGSGQRAIPISLADLESGGLEIDLLALDEALTRLGRLDAQKSRIVELRFFGGLTTEEVARLLQVTTRTVERHWAMARAWLYAELQPQK